MQSNLQKHLYGQSVSTASVRRNIASTLAKQGKKNVLTLNNLFSHTVKYTKIFIKQMEKILGT